MNSIEFSHVFRFRSTQNGLLLSGGAKLILEKSYLPVWRMRTM
jgi:hypothetical protein